MSGAIETAAAAPAPRAAEALQRDNAHGHFETKAGVEISTEQAPVLCLTLRGWAALPLGQRLVAMRFY